MLCGVNGSKLEYRRFRHTPYAEKTKPPTPRSKKKMRDDEKERAEHVI